MIEIIIISSFMSNQFFNFVIINIEISKNDLEIKWKNGIKFPELNLIFEPKIGKALIWNNLNEDGSINRNTMHQAHPVTHGEKTIITKWFREK